MVEYLENLVKLQKIDKQLLEIDNLKGDLPRVVETLQTEINRLAQQTKTEKEREKEIILEEKNLQAQIEDDKVLLNRYQDQLYLVTSNKEYDALISEIDNMKQDIDRSEYRILELGEELDKLKESIKINDLSIQEKTEDLQKRKHDLDRTDQQTKSQQAGLIQEREKVLELIPLRYMRQYERISQAKDGLAIVSIEQIFEENRDKRGNIEYAPVSVSCGGCHMIVPPQKIVEIKAGTQIIRCEFCGRMLYWDSQASIIRAQEEEEEIF